MYFHFKPGNFTAVFNQSRISTFEDVRRITETKSEQIVDARDQADFLKNHIPGSINLPFTDLFTGNATNMRLKDKKQLKDCK